MVSAAALEGKRTQGEAFDSSGAKRALHHQSTGLTMPQSLVRSSSPGTVQRAKQHIV